MYWVPMLINNFNVLNKTVTQIDYFHYCNYIFGNA